MAIIPYKIFVLMLLAMMLLTSPLAQGNTYTKGIDVSHHNGDIEWNKVAQQDIRFAYIKASESTDFKDEKFEVNIKDATSKYIWAGAYHYARPNLRRGAFFSSYCRFFHSTHEHL